MASWFNGVETAMGDVAVGAARSQSDWLALKAQAAAGTIRMEPGVAESCAKACQVAYDNLRVDLNSVQRCDRVDGLGSWPSGESIAQKFRDKAGGGKDNGNSAVGVIKLHQTVLLEMRDTFRAAGQAYAVAEQSNADRLRG